MNSPTLFLFMAASVVLSRAASTAFTDLDSTPELSTKCATRLVLFNADLIGFMSAGLAAEAFFTDDFFAVLTTFFAGFFALAARDFFAAIVTPIG
ncbi:MAG: hypothetical protein RLZZ113_1543 [Pseudomonadota bacterium]